MNGHIDIKGKLDQIGQVAFSTRQTLEATYMLATHCIVSGVRGAFVECGVAAGAQIGAMALACKVRGDWRKILMYDSFEGIPEAGPNDEEQPGIGMKSPEACGRLVSSGVSSYSLSQVNENLLSWDVFELEHIEARVGWFQNTVMVNPPEEIALLRLDGDLYESTRVCLEHLFPRVVHGGIVIVDDYALKGCKKAVDNYLAYRRYDMHEIKGGGGPVWFMKL